MADPEKKGRDDLESILSGATDSEPVDLDALAREADEAEAAEVDEHEVEGNAEADALRAERDELRDRLMRSMAEAENARKRGEKDRREAEHYGGTRLARDLLPVYDNLTRALATAKSEGADTTSPLVEGVDLTLRELLKIFEKHGISRIAPEKGTKFDPQFHEAMFEAPVPDTHRGEIIEVMGEGFLLHDRLLRPAQVGVSSNG